MKNYTTPEMKVIAFVAEETIAASAPGANESGLNGSNIYNDVELW